MADNTTLNIGTGGDVIASDDISGVKHQRVKVEFGADGSASDVAAGNPLPTSTQDTRNLAQNLALSSTANAVAVSALNGAASCAVQVTGTWTGTLVFEGTVDGSTFATLSAVASGSANQNATTTTANGMWEVTCPGLSSVRVRCSVTGTGTAVVSLSASSGVRHSDNGLWRPDSVPRIAMDGTTVFTDTFESLDTTNRWTTGISGSGTIPTVSGGNLTINVLAASTGSSALVSQPSFPLLATAYENNASIVQIDAAPVSGSHKRWWGLGIPQATPTVALPMLNGVVFETDDSVGSTGALYGAVYSGGVRTQQVVLVRPTDGSFHRYAIYNKTSRVYFEIDNVQVGSIGLPSTSVAALPLTIGAVTSGVTGSALLLAASLIGLSDTGRNNVALNDGTYQWRKQQVDALGRAAVITPEIIASGTITTQNLVPAGAATAGSAVEITTNGAPTLMVQVTGTYTGALSLQITVDGVTWVTMAGVPLINLNTGGYLAAITSALQSVFQADVSGAIKARVTGLAAVTGTATVSLRAVPGAAMVALDAALPTGANTIGAVTIASGTVTTVTTVSTVTSVSAVAAVTPGTAAANLGKAEDAVAASGDTGVFGLGVRRDALVISASANGDYNEQATDKYGSQQVRDWEKLAKTFSACSGNITVVASATDIFTISGNASNTVLVTKVRVSATQTAAGDVDIALIKRSSADTAGTSSNPTAVPHDSGDTVVSVITAYTANPTLGGTVGTVRFTKTQIGTTALTSPPIEWNFGERGKGILLSGTAQQLAVNLGGVTVTGGVFSVEIEWIEVP